MGVVKRMFRYSMGIAAAGFVGYEIGKMACRKSVAREHMRGKESMAYESREGPSIPRDYRSIYHLHE